MGVGGSCERGTPVTCACPSFRVTPVHMTPRNDATADEKQPPPLGPPYDPRYSPIVGSQEGGVSYERGAPVGLVHDLRLVSAGVGGPLATVPMTLGTVLL